MGIPAISLCAILAIMPLLWLPVLPERHTVWVMIAGGIALAAQRHNVLKYMGIMVLFCAWVFLLRRKASGRCNI